MNYIWNRINDSFVHFLLAINLRFCHFVNSLWVQEKNRQSRFFGHSFDVNIEKNKS